MTTKTDGTGARRSRARASGVRALVRAAAVEQPSRADRVARSKEARAAAPLDSHAEFRAGRSRDPVGPLLGQARSRVPVRHGRMLVSPFTFYRAALPMAADLAGAHPPRGCRYSCAETRTCLISARSPRRNGAWCSTSTTSMVTPPGPFEWDVKRLAASFAVAGRDNGFVAKARREIVLAAAEGYRTAMLAFAEQPLLDVWYTHVDIEQAIGEVRSQVKAKRLKAGQKLLAKAHTSDSTKVLRKLTTMNGGRRRIISDPPMIMPIEEVFADVQVSAIYEQIRTVLGKYLGTLQSDRRHLLEQFTLVQVARKVVGVGSVGTRAWIVLMDACDGDEPLFLQAKEAQPSVLADYCGASQHANQGERVVAGQHLMQAESDIFLGWTTAPGPDGVDRDFYVRQLKDWKFSFPIEAMVPSGMTVYARLCGQTLARAHARSGDRVALAAYLGGSGAFDQAIADFAETYADQNERDHAALQAAVKDGTVESTTEI